ncbi:hypothetical protein ACH4GE_24545 [Streptomyces tendae]|uniref:hypothetical protein n=1 Tax=Streptomyces tendae TaxID=1932 RepID=UPI0037BB2499
MARGHGRILTSIWDDADFLALDERHQRLYLFLISQPNLNHAGLLDLTLRRWSRKARGLTSAELEKLLQGLEDARFIVMDEDTEELLIRSFVRNDGVWKQPKVMGAMVSGALEISSRRLRHALLDEVDRIPMDELSDEPGARGVSIRQQVAEHIATLHKAFGNPPADPSGGGSRTPSRPPSGTPSDIPPHDPAEGTPEASTRGRAPASRAHSPAPAPAPAPEEDLLGAEADAGQQDDAEPSGSADNSVRPDVERVCEHLAAVIEKGGGKKQRISKTWRNDVRLLLDVDGVTPEQAIAAIDWAHADDFWNAHILSPGKLRAKYETLRRQAASQQRKRAPQGPPTAPHDTSSMTAEEKQSVLQFR